MFLQWRHSFPWNYSLKLTAQWGSLHYIVASLKYGYREPRGVHDVRGYSAAVCCYVNTELRGKLCCAHCCNLLLCAHRAPWQALLRTLLPPVAMCTQNSVANSAAHSAATCCYVHTELRGKHTAPTFRVKLDPLSSFCAHCPAMEHVRDMGAMALR